MTTRQEVAADAMVAMAVDGNVGYSQGVARTGLRGITPQQLRNGYVTDTDCSFSVSWANVTAGLLPSSVLYGTIWTGNMIPVYTANGATALAWSQVGVNGLQVGDTILGISGHTAMYTGKGMLCEAYINERGTITGGQIGDQTGGETRAYPVASHSWTTRGKWTHVLRFPVAQMPGTSTSTTKTTTATQAPTVLEAIANMKATHIIFQYGNALYLADVLGHTYQHIPNTNTLRDLKTVITRAGGTVKEWKDLGAKSNVVANPAAFGKEIK